LSERLSLLCWKSECRATATSFRAVGMAAATMTHLESFPVELLSTSIITGRLSQAVAPLSGAIQRGELGTGLPMYSISAIGGQSTLAAAYRDEDR